DAMLGGAAPSLVEIVVQGRLVAAGTATDPIVIGPTTTSAGTWGGLVFQGSSASSQLENVDVSSGPDCVRASVTRPALTSARIHACSLAAVAIDAGASATITGDAGTRGGLYDLVSHVWNAGGNAVNANGDVTITNTELGPSTGSLVLFVNKLNVTKSRL